jgi:hypothetical protein
VAIERVNALPAGSRAVFLWETRSLQCVSLDRCDPDVIIDRWWHLRRSVGSAGAILARWKAQGLTHVLVYDAGAEFVRAQSHQSLVDSDWSELEVLRRQMQLVENIGGVYALYALR